MEDLLVNFIGALVFSVIGFFYVKNRGKSRFASRFIPRKKRRENDYLAMIDDAFDEEQEKFGKKDAPVSSGESPAK